MVWNFLLLIIMLYVSMFLPLETAFLEETSLTNGITIFIDIFFFFDIVFTFFSSYEIENGREETSHKKIAIEYLKFWFWVDLIATIPSQLMD